MRKVLFVIFMCVVLSGTLAVFERTSRVEASAKKAEGHGAKKEEAPVEEVEEDTFDDSKSDVKHLEDESKKEEVAEEEGGHGGSKKEEGHGSAKKKGEGGGHGEEETVTQTEPEQKEFEFYQNIQSLADLMDEPEAKEENVRVVYRVPSSCGEFSIYLENKKKNLERMERELEHKQRLVTKLKQEFDESVQKYASLEKRIRNMMRTGDGKFADNPELAKMVKLYESISPEEAADRLKNLDLDLTLALLKGMNPKQLSQIMVALDPKLSAALSSRMVRGF